MQRFDFSTEICPSLHCSGCGEYIDVNGSFELEDEEVNALAALVRDHEGRRTSTNWTLRGNSLTSTRRSARPTATRSTRLPRTTGSSKVTATATSSSRRTTE